MIKRFTATHWTVLFNISIKIPFCFHLNGDLEDTSMYNTPRVGAVLLLMQHEFSIIIKVCADGTEVAKVRPVPGGSRCCSRIQLQLEGRCCATALAGQMCARCRQRASELWCLTNGFSFTCLGQKDCWCHLKTLLLEFVDS